MSARDRIGVFDSGLGGLTVMRKIREKLPLESIIYFGDTARLPYGSKSSETIIRYSVENSIFLMEQNIKVLVIACNTAAAHSAEKLRKIFNIPVLDVIDPGAQKACSVTQTRRIAVLATKATIQSKAYQRAIQAYLPDCFILSVPCPLLVHLVEERFLGHPATQLIIQEYLKPVLAANVDTVLLGCTHYPILTQMIQKELGPDIQVVDSATVTAERLSELLRSQDLEHSGTGECQFYVSDDPAKFMDLGSEFLGEPILNCEIYHHELVT